jgi:ATP synthase F1 gamma subunit
MSRIKEQKQTIDDIMSVRFITGALRDISAVQLKGLRKKFEKNEMFYTELQELFQLLWRIAYEENSNSIKLKKEKLYVAYTTNKHFYGSLNKDVMQKFIENTDSKSNCLIIGDTGKQIWMSKSQKRKEINFLSFKDDDPNTEEIELLLKKVAEYKNVYVFYPGFTSVFRQDVEIADITYKPSKESVKKKKFEDLPQYIFEPDLSEMVLFFNTQVRYVLFERLLLETQTARVAARLVKMDTADQNAKELVKFELRKLSRIRTSFSSRRMLETVVGYIQWHNKQNIG